MTTIEIRQRLIDRINAVTDGSLLEELYRILNNGKEDMAVYALSEEQKTEVHEAREDIKAGRIKTDEQANGEIEEWLKSKLDIKGTR